MEHSEVQRLCRGKEELSSTGHGKRGEHRAQQAPLRLVTQKKGHAAGAKGARERAGLPAEVRLLVPSKCDRSHRTV